MVAEMFADQVLLSHKMLGLEGEHEGFRSSIYLACSPHPSDSVQGRPPLSDDTKWDAILCGIPRKGRKGAELPPFSMQS